MTNVEVEDVLPEQEFAYTIYDNKTVVSVELYNEETSAWEKAPNGFFTFDVIEGNIPINSCLICNKSFLSNITMINRNNDRNFFTSIIGIRLGC
jgi:hypothetical protein